MTAKHYTPTAEERTALLQAPAQNRFEYFVKKVADWQEAWGLRDADGWVVLSDGEIDSFALWPAEAFAAAAAVNDWRDQVPTPIPLDRLIEELLPAWEGNGVEACVFWTSAGKGIVVPAAELRAALIDEAARCGDEYE